MIAASPLRRWIQAGVLCAIIDGLFSSGLTLLYGRPVARLWQGVAATAFGPGMLERGMSAVLVGLAMHVAVAFTWSAVFVVWAQRSSGLRRLLASPGGVLKAAALYGPSIWIVMSLAVIPLLTGNAPVITWRWWVQWVGHFPFVALPIAWSVAPGRERVSDA